MKVLFKSNKVKDEFYEAPLLLQYISEDFIRKSIQFGIEPVVTRVLEKVVGSSGVHESYRAVDFRDEFMGKRLYEAHHVEELLNYINSKWYRNDGKPTLVHHSFNGNPYHFHLQMALNTMTYWIR